MFVVASQRAEFNRGWTSVLANWGGLRQVDSLAALQRSLREKPASLMVIDAGLLDAAPVISIADLRAQCGETRLMLGDTHLAPLEELEALAAGAVACCSANLPREDLERIVGIVLEGGVWVSQATIPLLVAKLQAFSAQPQTQTVPPSAPPDRLEGLTQRQREVAEMVARGASNKHIARALDISNSTVKAHLTAIFEKLGTSDRLQLALYITDRKS